QETGTRMTWRTCQRKRYGSPRPTYMRLRRSDPNDQAPLVTVRRSRRLIELERLGIIREVPAAVGGHQDHVFDPNGAQARVVEAGLDGHDVAFQKSGTRTADARSLIDIHSETVTCAVEIALHAPVHQASLVAGLLEP